MTTKPLLFDSMTCPRCDGTGSYSWCQRFGSICFKCFGRGSILTEKGRKAQDYLDQLRKRRIEDFKVGDLAYQEGVVAGDLVVVKAGFFRIVEKYEDERGSTHLIGKDHAMQGPDGYMVRKGWSAEINTAFRAEALAFQARL